LPGASDSPTAYRCRREARHERLRVRGLEMHLRRWGPQPSPERPPVYLLHGWLDTGGTFQFLADAFERDMPLVAPDWRGFGRSAWAQDGYWFPDYLADLEALLDILSPDVPAALVGHSMGGNVASLYAGVRPDRVRCLVNLEGFGLPPALPAEAPQRLRQWLDQLQVTPSLNEYASFEQLAAVIRHRNPRIAIQRAHFLATVWARTDADGRVRLWGDARHKRINPILYRREEAEACWRNVTAPMLLLAGAESSYLARVGAERAISELRRLVPNSEAATIEGAGHLLHLERPDAVAPLIEAFLNAN
jgi:pimeloyl-ACP methyl ester carboxylesterase